MLLRRITLERYACFGSKEFDFRSGLNLISGGNDAGKTLLLTALPAALFGVENGSRLRSWGDMVCCRVILLFEGDARAVRLARDLESNLVRLEERNTDGIWRDCFVGLAPVSEGGEYLTHLARSLDVDGVALLRAIVDPLEADAVLDSDGRLVAGLWPLAAQADSGTSETAALADARIKEITILEAELVDDRREFQKGRDYLEWIRRRWQLKKGKGGEGGKSTSCKAPNDNQDELRHQRDLLLEELRRHGLPGHLPGELPAMFAAAEGLRQELAALQLELNPLQRRKQGVSIPGVTWPLIVTLISTAAAAGVWWSRPAWSPWLLAGCAALTLLFWANHLLRWQRARTVLASLDKELQAVELRRDAALARQHQLAEQFEAHGLPSAPVDMVKLQQLFRRHQELIGRYHQLCAQLAAGGDSQTADTQVEIAAKHLRLEELPEAEARLAALGESLREREIRLQELRAASLGEARQSTAVKAGPAVTQQRLLAAIGQQLDRLSAGRYREVRMEEGCLHLAIAPGRWAPPSACSRSAVTCFVLAVRMALAELAGCRLPLTVDDLTQLLDQKRRQTAIRWLERFSRDNQVLLASADEELAKRAVKEHWQIIRLDQPRAQPTLPGDNADAGQLHLL